MGSKSGKVKAERARSEGNSERLPTTDGMLMGDPFSAPVEPPVVEPETPPVETAALSDTQAYPLPSAGDAEEADLDVSAQREHIARTREEMSETIAEIEERLSPHNLVEQAKETVREAATDKVHQAEQAVENIVESAREAAAPAVQTAREQWNRTYDTAREAGAKLMAKVQQRPALAAAVGLAVAMLLLANRRSRAHQDAECR